MTILVVLMILRAAVVRRRWLGAGSTWSLHLCRSYLGMQRLFHPGQAHLRSSDLQLCPGRARQFRSSVVPRKRCYFGSQRLRGGGFIFLSVGSPVPATSAQTQTKSLLGAPPALIAVLRPQFRCLQIGTRGGRATRAGDCLSVRGAFAKGCLASTRGMQLQASRGGTTR